MSIFEENLKEKKSTDWNVYPRPQLRRDYFQILNDGWELNRQSVELPFVPESKLSGFKGDIPEKLYYTTKVIIESKLMHDEGLLLLHFGAVDQIADVYINGDFIYRHKGGYLPFTVDITPFVMGNTFNLKVEVVDELNHLYPYGKQRRDRGGMWYTPISGIWQSVWLEWVPDSYIKNIKLTSNDRDELDICLDIAKPINLLQPNMDVDSENTDRIHIEIPELEYDEDHIFENSFGRLLLDVHAIAQKAGKELIHWIPEKPKLYYMNISYGSDTIRTYFALRTISIRKFGKFNRICLNGKPIFLNGVLDQGYFESGIYTPASYDEYEKDIMRMKKLGFNMLRKHIKVEPDIFYHYCDMHGMLIMQDMVNNGDYSFKVDTLLPTIGIKHISDIGRVKNNEQKEIFVTHSQQIIEHLYNHPCVVGYTVFNEGWGQTDSDEIGDKLRKTDNTRFYDYTSGWFAQNNSDVDSEHVYFRTKKLSAKDKPLILSEFGGYARSVEGHIWNPNKSYGYGTCKDEETLTDRIIKTYEKMVIPAIENGLCASVYTQVSDVEDEINGFYTYDREICKVDEVRILEMNHKLYKKAEFCM